MTKSTLRSLCLALALVLTVLGLGCNNTKTYSISFAGDNADLIDSMPTEAAEGEEVDITVFFVTDVDLKLYANGEEITQQEGNKFTFTMPAEDVEITLQLVEYPGGGA